MGGDGGVALVEFALVAPILLLVIVGIVDVGRSINAYVTISNAAREGAHYAALHPAAPSSAIASAVQQRVVPLDPSSVSVIATYWDGSTFKPWPSGGIPASSPAVYVPTRVQVSYPWRAVTFVIGVFFPNVTTCGGAATTADACFSASSTMDTLR